jgi:hypothetical protein
MVSKFGKYKPESEKTVRDAAEVAQNPVIDAMKKAWKKLDYTFGKDQQIAYENAVELVRELDYCARDVEEFSIALAEFQEERGFDGKAGLLLCALINEGMDKEYVIHTAHLGVLPDYIGYRNRKSITVKGGAGFWCGELMSGGSIVVEGDVGGAVGRMMNGGEILVKGNASGIVGQYMRGGEIHLEGEYESISVQFKHGKIHYKGKLIVDK